MAKKISKKVSANNISKAVFGSSSKAKNVKRKVASPKPKKKSAGKAKRVIRPTKRRDEERK